MRPPRTAANSTPPRSHVPVKWAVLALALAVGACTGPPAEEDLLRLPALEVTTDVPGAAAVPDAELVANGTYDLPGFQGPIGLRRGRWRDRVTGTFAQLAEGTMVSGDFDGDGQGESAAVLIVGGAATPMRFFLVGVGIQQGRASQEAALFLGSGVQLRGMRAAEGSVEVRMLDFGPGDGPCCPSQATVRRLRIAGGTWVDA